MKAKAVTSSHSKKLIFPSLRSIYYESQSLQRLTGAVLSLRPNSETARQFLSSFLSKLLRAFYFFGDHSSPLATAADPQSNASVFRHS
jgi:hypothetical protein